MGSFSCLQIFTQIYTSINSDMNDFLNQPQPLNGHNINHYYNAYQLIEVTAPLNCKSPTQLKGLVFVDKFKNK